MTVSRCSNNYGPYHFRKLIPLMIINALNDKALPVYGDGLTSAIGSMLKITAGLSTSSFARAVSAKSITSAATMK